MIESIKEFAFAMLIASPIFATFAIAGFLAIRGERKANAQAREDATRRSAQLHQAEKSRMFPTPIAGRPI